MQKETYIHKYAHTHRKQHMQTRCMTDKQAIIDKGDR